LRVFLVCKHATLDVEEYLVAVGNRTGKYVVRWATHVALIEKDATVGSEVASLVPVVDHHLIRHGLRAAVLPTLFAVAGAAVEVSRAGEPNREWHACDSGADRRELHAPRQLALAEGNPASKLGGAFARVLRAREYHSCGVADSGDAMVDGTEGAP